MLRQVVSKLKLAQLIHSFSFFNMVHGTTWQSTAGAQQIPGQMNNAQSRLYILALMVFGYIYLHNNKIRREVLCIPRIIGGMNEEATCDVLFARLISVEESIVRTVRVWTAEEKRTKWTKCTVFSKITCSRLIVKYLLSCAEQDVSFFLIYLSTVLLSESFPYCNLGI